MKYFSINPIYTVIDIGTTKICAIISEKRGNEIKILGIGQSPSYGLEKGIVYDIDLTSKSIKEAIEEAQAQAQIFIESVIVGISGTHIKSYFSQGMISISQTGITEKTIYEATMAAQSIALPDDEKIIHTLPTNYTIDGIHQIKNPLGMHGFRLEVTIHIMTANKHAIANIIESCRKSLLKVTDIVLEPIASATAVLNQEEKELGALLIDIGGGTSDIVLYKNNTLEQLNILNIAGNMFTKDLSICLNINKEKAEILKKEYGILCSSDNQLQNIITTSIDNLTEICFSTDLIQRILRARAEELLTHLIFILDNCYCGYNLPAGIILTGGGGLLKGLPELITKHTGMRCRVGLPLIQSENHKAMHHPSFATCYGLLLYTVDQDKRFESTIRPSLIQKFKNFIQRFI